MILRLLSMPVVAMGLVLFIQSDVFCQGANEKSLEKAVASFDRFSKSFPVEVEEWFTKEEQRIRKLRTGIDAALESLRKDQDLFIKKKVLPPGLPRSLSQKRTDAIRKMLTAFNSSIEECRKAGNDDQAEALKKDRENFLEFALSVKERSEQWIVGRWKWPAGTMVFFENGTVREINQKGNVHATGLWKADSDGVIRAELENGWVIELTYEERDSLHQRATGPGAAREEFKSNRIKE